MSNKRIQKKRAKAAEYRRRVNLVAKMAVWLCPGGTKYQQRCEALSLWKLNDRQLLDLYWRESLRRSPFRRMIPRKTWTGEVVNWRPITCMETAHHG